MDSQQTGSFLHLAELIEIWTLDNMAIAQPAYEMDAELIEAYTFPSFMDSNSQQTGSNPLAKPCEQAGTSWSDSNPNVWRPVPRQVGQQTDESLFGVAGPCAQTGTSSSGPIPSSLGSSGGSAWRSVPTSQGGSKQTGACMKAPNSRTTSPHHLH
ncbi:uncharacterized protein LOC131173363 isoform X2 [Hevea brasiliensis]|uniref:uncharacterized protein LOC131173363 isoform X2 n=1 Tax=Hevea brasiliensis TaxID=3981 RepID=UPI0025F98EE8|nr:uncharacterized protein LOC131173363 isoform X2 [Hevea brasiliensis]